MITILITLAIRFSMGEVDNELTHALEKIINAGIYEDICTVFIHPTNDTKTFLIIRFYALTKGLRTKKRQRGV